MTAQHFALALDLQDDAVKIAAYESAHENIWPEIREHLRENGILNMEIFRLGTRLFMLMQVDPAIYTPEKMALSAKNNIAVQNWEQLMWRYQAPTPWAKSGEKWVLMKKIFELTPPTK